jgi:hypothetical protein
MKKLTGTHSEHSLQGDEKFSEKQFSLTIGSGVGQ